MREEGQEEAAGHAAALEEGPLPPGGQDQAGQDGRPGGRRLRVRLQPLLRGRDRGGRHQGPVVRLQDPPGDPPHAGGGGQGRRRGGRGGREGAQGGGREGRAQPKEVQGQEVLLPARPPLPLRGGRGGAGQPRGQRDRHRGRRGRAEGEGHLHQGEEPPLPQEPGGDGQGREQLHRQGGVAGKVCRDDIRADLLRTCSGLRGDQEA